jgi:hypothetical protein
MEAEPLIYRKRINRTYPDRASTFVAGRWVLGCFEVW